MHEHMQRPDCHVKSHKRVQLVVPSTHRKKTCAGVHSQAGLIDANTTYAQSQTCQNKLMYPLKYFCMMKTVSLWTVVCFSKGKVLKPVLCGSL